MTKKIFRSILLVAAAVLLLCFVVIMGVLYGRMASIEGAELSAQAALAARGVESAGAEYFDGLRTKNCRITWIAADGRVLYDSEADAAAMGDHSDREEVREALESGVGESYRYSDTVLQKTLYRAQRLNDGTVLRVSATQYTVVGMALSVLRPALIVLAAAVGLSALLAKRLAGRIIGPLNELDLDRPLNNDVYEELSPLLTRIERQQREIERRMDELVRRREEFAAVTDGMSEGLMLLGADGTILSINPSAAKLFNVQGDCVGRHMLSVDRSLAMQGVIDEAMAGRRGEALIALPSGEYQIGASPISCDGEVRGICLFAFNVTERAMAERQRREFSANVSHELKTPLHAILGAAELIESGLVPQEDIARFTHSIRAEASRLVTLVNDIIRLSQLDEGVELQRENVDLLAAANETADELRDEAAKRGITLNVGGEHATVHGVRRLLYEIAYNLIDNAIKYNTDNGRVDILVTGDKNGAALTVSDTGIGIPREHQERIFERFYRVDKSHSRETGGTGLGLSIVKHAVLCHGGSIELDSAESKGTRVTVRFG